MFPFQYQNLAVREKTAVKMDNLSLHIATKFPGRLNISIGIFISSETNRHKYFFSITMESIYSQKHRKSRRN